MNKEFILKKLKYFIKKAESTNKKPELKLLLSALTKFEQELTKNNIRKQFELKLIKEIILTKLYKEKVIL